MKIKTVTICREALINLGNFENTKISITLSAELDDFDDRGVIVKELSEEAASYLRTEGKRIEKLMDREEGYKRY